MRGKGQGGVVTALRRMAMALPGLAAVGVRIQGRGNQATPSQGRL
jgi:hypothetical protein